MNGQPVNEKQRTGLVYGLTILGAFLIHGVVPGPEAGTCS